MNPVRNHARAYCYIIKFIKMNNYNKDYQLKLSSRLSAPLRGLGAGCF